MGKWGNRVNLQIVEISKERTTPSCLPILLFVPFSYFCRLYPVV